MRRILKNSRFVTGFSGYNLLGLSPCRAVAARRRRYRFRGLLQATGKLLKAIL